MLAVAGCGRSSAGCSRGAPPAAGGPGSAGAGGRALAGGGGIAGAGGAGGATALVLEEGQQVLFIGGFISEVYEELSANLEDEINAALRDAARTLNVHIPLPLDKSIDLPIGDAIADALPRLDLPIQEGGFTTFYTQMRQFDAQGVDYQYLSAASADFNSSQSVAHNAAVILRFLRRTDKQVIIVTHSKGGLDTLHALIAAPELWGDTVLGWVALQAPFFGSPIADPTFSSANDFLLEALGGSGQSADDLKTERRESYMLANERRITKLTARVPVISAYSTYEASATVQSFASTFASSIFNASLVSEISEMVVQNYRYTPSDVPRVIAASTSAAIRLIRERLTGALGEALATIGLMDLANVYMNGVLTLPNDGLVPSESTRLPGAVHAELPLGDHGSPVMDVDPMKNFWTVSERNDVTIELIEEVRRLAEETNE